MLWFRWLAGVSLSSMLPQAHSVAPWLQHGWRAIVAYVIGFLVMLALVGWHPPAQHREGRAPAGQVHENRAD